MISKISQKYWLELDPRRGYKIKQNLDKRLTSSLPLVFYSSRQLFATIFWVAEGNNINSTKIVKIGKPNINIILEDK